MCLCIIKIMKFIFVCSILLFSAVLGRDIFLGEDHEAGFIELMPTDEMFYWLMRSRNRPSRDPLVLWLTGGPGCGSQMSIFYQHGPWYVNDDLTLRKNPHSWNEVANVVYVDQPLGSGFSSTEKPEHRARDQDDVNKALYLFLVKFFDKYPEFKGRNFYIAGESYAGHYVPGIVAYIIEQRDPNMNLIASAIGNGWVNPRTQYPYYRDFAVEHNLINVVHSALLYPAFIGCQLTIDTGYNYFAYKVCEWMMNTIVGRPKAFNVFDISKPCEGFACYDFSNFVNFLERKDVREIINVGDRPYYMCNGEVFKEMKGDQVNNFQPHVKYALENGVGVLVYNGDLDFICNWMGSEAWANEVYWEHQDTFRSAEYQKWIVDGEEAGQYKRVKDFTVIRVFDAGHMVPMDQPKRALEMFKDFIARDFFYPESPLE
ncbi:unnamed protein product [Moneuplotes crassus]|uniref:Carboxypeptidase n=1 Tax=Euplotes crassus TaxID=5936 RepID=A0AAD1XG29_EUPCR|nr:unnamed protein product [Moneuplotes crassus]